MKKWVKERRGRKMIVFNFKGFMQSENLTVEVLAKLLGYTVEGTITMLNRGTIKINNLVTLKKRYPGAIKYERIKTPYLIDATDSDTAQDEKETIVGGDGV